MSDGDTELDKYSTPTKAVIFKGYRCYQGQTKYKPGDGRLMYGNFHSLHFVHYNHSIMAAAGWSVHICFLF